MERELDDRRLEPDDDRLRSRTYWPGGEVDLAALCTQAAELAGVSASPTALYLSAGNDSRPLTLLSGPFLAERNSPEAPAPAVCVYVDRIVPPEEPAGSWHEDARTSISTVRRRRVAQRPESWLHAVEVRSDTPGVAGMKAIVRIRARNELVIRAAIEAGWCPDVLITVCDGCAFGGQVRDWTMPTYIRCESQLRARSPDHPWRLAGPGRARWWVTDHFGRHFGERDQLRDGDLLVPPEPVGFALVKRAKLASDWGHRWGCFQGANLFEVVEPPAGMERRRQGRESRRMHRRSRPGSADPRETLCFDV